MHGIFLDSRLSGLREILVELLLRLRCENCIDRFPGSLMAGWDEVRVGPECEAGVGVPQVLRQLLDRHAP